MTKEDILQKVGSYNILNHYLQPYNNHDKLLSGMNISNPFLLNKQETPSFNIFCALPQHEWEYNDFANDDKGSCFDLVMKLFNLNFADAIQKIVQDFELESSDTSSPNEALISTVPVVEKPSFTVKVKNFTDKELAFWQRFKITQEILQSYKVISLEEYSSKSKEDKPYTVKSSIEKFIFGYKNGDAIKIYKPLDDKKYRFQFLGNKEPDFKFGWAQLPQNGEIVFITGGEKDVLTLAAHGYNAFTLNSETATLDNDIVKELKERFTKVVVLYDNDETGIKQSQKLVQEHQLYSIALPEMPDGKDISDFFALGNSLESFNKLIDDMPPVANNHPQNAEMNSSDSNNNPDFAKFANLADLQTPNSLIDVQKDKDEYLKSTPFFPDDIFDKLPDLLKDGTKVFSDKRKRDVFLTGALAIVSGCLPKVTGVYFQERVFAHFFSFIIAPAASGKGVLKNAKRLANKYHQQVVEKSKIELAFYETQLAEYKLNEKKQSKGNEAIPKPIKPPFRIVFIPADCSKARLIEHLKANEGKGIICETEADTMSNTKKQDWGDYSPLLRNAFHHEPITHSRKTDNILEEIIEPCIAMALSGTPAQAPRLLSSAEDGLFSRFLFYAFKSNIEWQDPSPFSSSVVFNDHFDELADRVLVIVTFLENDPTEVELTRHQWDCINNEFPVILKDVVAFASEDAVGVVYRLGLILFRICMIFTALRKVENGESAPKVFCTDEDFNTALKIVKTFLEHSLFMFNNLPKQEQTMTLLKGNNKKLFFEALPKEFTRKEAVELGVSFKISDSGVGQLLAQLLGRYLTQPKYGCYKKI